LQEWTRSGAVQTEVANKLGEWLDSGLQEWDISRDAPYFGFEIPNAPGKYFYVWLDAPIGYMAAFKNLCDRDDIDFDQYWAADSTTELYHFIGLSARILLTSMPCSGPPCLKAPTTAPRPKCASMVLSRLMAKR